MIKTQQPYKDLERDTDAGVPARKSSLTIYRCLVYFLVIYNLGLTVIFGLAGWFALNHMSDQDANMKQLQQNIQSLVNDRSSTVVLSVSTVPLSTGILDLSDNINA